MKEAGLGPDQWNGRGDSATAGEPRDTAGGGGRKERGEWGSWERGPEENRACSRPTATRATHRVRAN